MAEDMIDDSGIETFHCSDTEDDITRTSVVSKAPLRPFRILLVKDAALDTELVKACQSFKVPISIVEDFGSDERTNDASLSVYVVTSFDGICDKNYNNSGYRIVGRSALLEIAKKYEDGGNKYTLPFADLPKPLYCHAMSGQVICFAGFKKMEELVTLKSLVNFMGGCVRKDMNIKTTHLVAKFYKREKFTYAMLFNVPIVSEMWVQDAWQRRDSLDFDANDADFVSKYKLKIFFGSKICFLGFPEEEKNHMIEVLKENGGESVDLTDATCTHMVMDDSSTPVRVSFIKHPYFCSSSLISDSLVSAATAIKQSNAATTTTTPCYDLFANPPKKLKWTYTTDDKENYPCSSTNDDDDDGDDWSMRRLRDVVRRRSKNCSRALNANSVVVVDSERSSSREDAVLGLKCDSADDETKDDDDDDFVASQAAENDSPVEAESIPVAQNVTAQKAEETAAIESRSPADSQRDPSVRELEYAFMFDTPVRGATYSPTTLSLHVNVAREVRYDWLVACLWFILLSLKCVHRILKVRAKNEARKKDRQPSSSVVDDMKIVTPPPLKSTKAFVVKAEWFWSSIQYERRQNELDFKVDGVNQPAQNSIQSPNLTALSFSGGSLSSGGGNRKRKRKSRILNAISVGGDSSPQSAQKQRRSSAADLTKVSESSFLDYTTSSILTNDDTESVTSEKSKTSKRYHKFLELWHTETNYVGILRTIMTLFKADLEAMVDKKDQLLNATELKIIFGHLPPIYTTHCRMLDDLNQMIANWNEDSSIGSLISKYSNDLEKAYPPFINFFENTRDMLIKCDKTKPRFHAFLKLRQSKPECGRQSLQDLLIRPVQRLPSINLLLNDILRNTPQTSVDYKNLDAAIKEIQNVMTYINEDKKRTEGQVALFDIFNEIEKCPADLVSSQRCFISRCEVTELSDDLSGKGDPLVLFLFSDVIEVCKKRTKAFSKENNGTVSSKHGHMKLYKHVDLIPLSSILKVIDIKETDDCRNIFALIVRRNHDTKEGEECVYSFTITDSTGADKCKYLRSLCHQIANVVCTTDTEGYFMQLEAQQLDIDSSDVTTGSLGKAFNKFASKTRVKVGRALSFNKTPSKLRRAMSTMMSPFGSQNGLTPSSQLANLQLAALPPIPNFGEESHSPNTPSRKMKSASFSMGSLRRL